MASPDRMASHDSVTSVRVIHAPRGDVFAAWTRPELMKKWAVDDFAGDPRPGGRYRQVKRDEQGDHVVSGEYREFVPGDRLVLTWNYQGPAPDERSESVVTVQLDEPAPGMTEVVVTEAPVAPEAASAAEAAWRDALGALGSLLEE